MNYIFNCCGYNYEKEDDYDYRKKYNCSRYTRCNHFSKLMFLIINVNSIYSC